MYLTASTSPVMTGLAWSIKNGDIDVVKEAINETNVNSDIGGGRKPMHYAADFGQNEVIEYLLAKGADINAVDNHGLTALLTAIYEGHVSTVKLLLSKGAKGTLLAPDGRPYVECAENSDIRDILLQHG